MIPLTPLNELTCAGCGGQCCRSFVLPIDTPETRQDFDALRWLVLHRGVQFLVNGTRWEIEVALPCSKLQPDGRCSIYGSRPQVCIDYEVETCERHRPPHHDARIDNEHALEAWIISRYGMRPSDPHFPAHGPTMRVGLFG